MSLLKVKNISTGYGKKQVLYNISFEVKQSDIALLIGSNGSGKSTLLKAIYSLLPIWKSNTENSLNDNDGIYFNEENITHLPTSKLLRKGLLYIPQQNNLFVDLTVKENLQMAGLSINNHKLLLERIDNALALFPELIQHLKRTPMKISGGERKLLILAMATLHQPKMILIDELFNEMSPQNFTFALESLERLNKKDGTAFLIVEHRVKEIYFVAKKIISLKLGKVYSIKDVNEDFDVQDLYEIFV